MEARERLSGNKNKTYKHPFGWALAKHILSEAAGWQSVGRESLKRSLEKLWAGNPQGGRASREALRSCGLATRRAGEPQEKL